MYSLRDLCVKSIKPQKENFFSFYENAGFSGNRRVQQALMSLILSSNVENHWKRWSWISTCLLYAVIHHRSAYLLTNGHAICFPLIRNTKLSMNGNQHPQNGHFIIHAFIIFITEHRNTRRHGIITGRKEEKWATYAKKELSEIITEWWRKVSRPPLLSQLCSADWVIKKTERANARAKLADRVV